MQTISLKPRAVLGYFATVRPLVQLLWQAQPWFFVASLSLTLLSGLIPTANIFITSALLEALVEVVRTPPTGPALPSGFARLLLLLGALSLLGRFLSRLSATVQLLYQTRVTNYVELRIAEKTASIDLACFENPAFHNEMQLVVDQASFRPLTILNHVTVLASTLTTIISLGVVVLLWQVWIVPVIVCSALLMLFTATHFGTARVELIKSRSETERQKQYLRTLLTSDQAAKEIRLFSLRSFLLGRFRGLLELTYRQDRQLATRQLLLVGLAEALLAAVLPLLISFTALQAVRGLISIGQFSLYTQSFVQLEGGLTNLMFTLGDLHESNLFVLSLFNFLQWQPEVEAIRPGGRLPLTGRPPRIEFREVSFTYPDTERPVLERVSLTIAPGERIALVGENGAGKTTLVKLLMGLYAPSSGQILLDGVDIETLDRDELRAQLSVILQDYTTYHFSVSDNIGLGQVARIDDAARIAQAARRSGVEALVSSLPDGYATVLGRFWNSGHELSGGQQQTVALGRAFMRAAPVLILDEPSAALDVHAERRFFQQLLDQQLADPAQTVLFISHRLTTVRRADRILVLEHGRLIEQGPHEQLMELRGRYHDMFNLQANLYLAPQAPASGHALQSTP